MGNYIRTASSSSPFISAVTLSQLSADTVTSNLQEAYNRFWSAGIYSGATYSINDASNIDISEGYGVLRKSASPFDELVGVKVPETTGLTVSPGTMGYIYADYNGGNPIFTSTTNIQDFNCQDKCLIYTVFHNTAFEYDFIDGRAMNEDANTKHRRKLLKTTLFEYGIDGVSFNKKTTGLDFYLTSGYTWYGLNRIALNSFDTALGDTFIKYYRNGVGGFTEESGSTLNSVEYDDNSPTLASASTNNYVNRFAYQLPNDNGGRIALMYGQNEYQYLVDAQRESPPSTLPVRLNDMGKYVGRIVTQAGNNDIRFIESNLDLDYWQVPDFEHNSLASLQGGQVSSGQYFHLTENEYTYLQNLVDGNVSGATTFAKGLSSTTNVHITKRATFGVYTAPIGSSSYAIDLSNGSLQFLKPNTSSVVSFTNALPGTYIIVFQNTATATVTCATSSGWHTPGGGQPTYTNTNGAINVWTLVYDGTQMLVTSTQNFTEIT